MNDLLAIPGGPGFGRETLIGFTDQAVELPGPDYSFAALVKTIPQDRFLLGHGWGAAMALECALAQPHPALILVSPLCRFGPEGQDTTAQARQVERVDPTLGSRFAQDVRPAFEAAMAGQTRWQLVEQHPWWGQMILTQFATPPPPSWSFSINLSAYAAYKGAAMFQGDDHMASYDLTERAHELSPRIPVLIISSNHDANYVAKADAHAIPLHHAIPNSKLVLWDDAGHFPFVERPTDFSALVSEFIDGHK